MTRISAGPWRNSKKNVEFGARPSWLARRQRERRDEGEQWLTGLERAGRPGERALLRHLQSAVKPLRPVVRRWAQAEAKTAVRQTLRTPGPQELRLLRAGVPPQTPGETAGAGDVLAAQTRTPPRTPPPEPPVTRAQVRRMLEELPKPQAPDPEELTAQVLRRLETTLRTQRRRSGR